MPKQLKFIQICSSQNAEGSELMNALDADGQVWYWTGRYDRNIHELLGGWKRMPMYECTEDEP